MTKKIHKDRNWNNFMGQRVRATLNRGRSQGRVDPKPNSPGECRGEIISAKGHRSVLVRFDGETNVYPVPLRAIMLESEYALVQAVNPEDCL